MAAMTDLSDLTVQGLEMKALKNLAGDLDIELRPNAADRVREAIAEIERLKDIERRWLREHQANVGEY